MGKCYVCQKGVVPGKPEHIIPNCIGGKLTSVRILCSDCNNNFAMLDKAFEDVAVLTNFVRPHRDNGNTPSVNVEINGVPARMLGDGNIAKVGINVSKEDDGLRLHYQTLHRPGSPQAIKHREKLIKTMQGLLKKKDWTDEKKEEKLAEVLKQWDEGGETTENNLIRCTFSLNSKGTLFPAILKIIVGYYVYCDLEWQYIKNALDVLRDEQKWKNADSIVCFYDWNISQQIGTAHVVYLRGDSKENILYGIFSLYNSVSFMVVLNDEYNGPEIKKTYCYQLNERTTIPLLEDVLISREILKQPEAEEVLEIVEKGFARFLPRFVRPKTTDFDGSEKEATELSLYVHEKAEATFLSLCSKYQEVNAENYSEFFIQEALTQVGKSDKFGKISITYKREIFKNYAVNEELYPYKKYMESIISRIVSDRFANYVAESLAMSPQKGEYFFKEVYEQKERCLNYALEQLAHFKIDNAEINEYYHTIFPQRRETYKQIGEEVITRILSPFIQKNT